MKSVYRLQCSWHRLASPLAEGRELKYIMFANPRNGFVSPLAEGRELK